MKIFTLITLIALSSSAMAQQKKTAVKTYTKTVTVTVPVQTPPAPLADTTIAREQAETYFKKTFVEVYFKDPYSYKLLKCEAKPVTFNEAYTDSLKTSSEQFVYTDTTKESGKYQISKKGYEIYHAKNLAQEKKKKKSEMYQSELHLTGMYKADMDSSAMLFNKWKADRVRYKSTLDGFTEERKLQVAYYRIYLDCYAKNSVGAQILGRYSFYYKINVGAISTPVKYND